MPQSFQEQAALSIALDMIMTKFHIKNILSVNHNIYIKMCDKKWAWGCTINAQFLSCPLTSIFKCSCLDAKLWLDLLFNLIQGGGGPIFTTYFRYHLALFNGYTYNFETFCLFLNIKNKDFGKIWHLIFYPSPPRRGVLKYENFRNHS